MNILQPSPAFKLSLSVLIYCFCCGVLLCCCVQYFLLPRAAFALSVSFSLLLVRCMSVCFGLKLLPIIRPTVGGEEPFLFGKSCLSCLLLLRLPPHQLGHAIFSILLNLHSKVVRMQSSTVISQLMQSSYYISCVKCEYVPSKLSINTQNNTQWQCLKLPKKKNKTTANRIIMVQKFKINRNIYIQAYTCS